MRPQRYLLATAALALAIPAIASDQADVASGDKYRQLLLDAVAALDAADWKRWAYTETDIGSDGVYVGRFDPSRPEGQRWSLLRVNNRAPTRDETEAYLDEKAGDNGWGGDDDGQSDTIVDMVEPDGLELLEETDDHYVFRFVPDEDDLEEGFAEFLDATLGIAKGGTPWLEYIDIHSDGMFSPQFGVRVRDFKMRMTFAPAIESGPIVPRSIEVRISIHAFLIINVDEHIVTSYTDYERVGD